MDHHARRNRQLLPEPAEGHDPRIRVAHSAWGRDVGSQSAECRNGCKAVRAHVRHGGLASVESRRTADSGKSLPPCVQEDSAEEARSMVDIRIRKNERCVIGLPACDMSFRRLEAASLLMDFRQERRLKPSLLLASTN
jgi:hypothetical protein